jgi:hypothetical protein
VARLLLPPRPRAVRPPAVRVARSAVAARALQPEPQAAALASEAPTSDASAPSVASDTESQGRRLELGRPLVAADAETVLPPPTRPLPPPLPVRSGAWSGASLAGDVDDSEDETPTGINISVPEPSFPPRIYGPVVDLSRPTVSDLEPPLALVSRPRPALALARREPVTVHAGGLPAALVHPLARRPLSVPSMPLALMKPHVRIAKGLAHDVRASKREIVIGLSIGLTLAAPLFIAGHLYLQHRRAARAPAHAGFDPAVIERAQALPVAPRGAQERAPERPQHTDLAPPGGIQRAVAGLAPTPPPRPGRPRPEATALSVPAPKPHAVSATLAAKPPPPRRRVKPARPPRPRATEEAPRAQTDADDVELSPAERAGLTTTIPF